MKHALILGGTSGLGRELAKQLSSLYEITVTGTGRHEPDPSYGFHKIDLSQPAHLSGRLKKLVEAVAPVDLVVYAAGFAQMGTLDKLSDDDIDAMLAVGLAAPAILVREILLHQGGLDTFIAVTSSSATTPRREEPIYAASKAGLSMLTNSVSLDERISKVVEIAPGGMDTPFWAQSGVDTEGFLNPSTVASHTLDALSGEFRYKRIVIGRATGEPTIIEQR